MIILIRSSLFVLICLILFSCKKGILKSNDSDSSVVYSNSHQFSSTDLSYVSLSTPLNLQNGVAYTLRRIQTNWQTYITNTIFHAIQTEEADYPLQVGSLKITKTQFHAKQSNNSTLNYVALPRIDLVFQ